MNKQRGYFTMIEIMICIGIVAILGTVGFNVYHGVRGDSTVNYGINGMTESRCIDGYKFIVGERGFVQQVIGANGGGVQCNNMK